MTDREFNYCWAHKAFREDAVCPTCGTVPVPRIVDFGRLNQPSAEARRG